MKPTLFSVGYAGLWGQQALGLGEFIDKAGELGYSSVMLMGKRPHLSPLDATAEQIADLKAHLDRAGVACSIVAGYTDFASAGAAEVPWMETQIAYVESLCRLARELGASIVRVFTAYETAGLSPATLWGRVVAALRECCDRAASLGVTIAVQNHHDIAVHSDALLELLGDVDRPNCRLSFDAWSPALRGEDLYESARRMAPYAVCTTNADYARLPRFRYRPELVNYEAETPMIRAVPFGEGFIDYRAFFAGLREGGFDGAATYEMCSPLRGGGETANLDRYARQYLRWLAESAE
ncbi:MAG: sugar phosphate isomerase/epimerase [Pirellulales bacterium]|nr:sugar phosphate isomerase/epimerase [Pirellulales bacterium]